MIITNNNNHNKIILLRKQTTIIVWYVQSDFDKRRRKAPTNLSLEQVLPPIVAKFGGRPVYHKRPAYRSKREKFYLILGLEKYVSVT
jgi:hypothetical protein